MFHMKFMSRSTIIIIASTQGVSGDLKSTVTMQRVMEPSTSPKQVPFLIVPDGKLSVKKIRSEVTPIHASADNWSAEVDVRKVQSEITDQRMPFEVETGTAKRNIQHSQSLDNYWGDEGNSAKRRESFTWSPVPFKISSYLHSEVQTESWQDDVDKESKHTQAGSSLQINALI